MLEIKEKAGELSAWLADAHAESILLVVDFGVADLQIRRDTLAAASAGGLDVTEKVVSGTGSLQSAWELSTVMASSGTDVIVVVGGGAAMDRAKLANVMTAGSSIEDMLLSGDRSSMRLVPSDARRHSRLITVPTTVGTGSERSSNAVVSVAGRRLLVSGQNLRADVAILDDVASATLTPDAVAEGIFEALCRTVSPYIGSAPSSPSADLLAEAVAVRLVTIGHMLAGEGRDMWPAQGALRSEVARLSGLSHTDSMHRGRDPFSFKAWYITHEMTSSSVTKARALAALLPEVWEEILADHDEWGIAARLRTIWTRIRDEQETKLNSDPAIGLRELLSVWGIDRTDTVADSGVLEQHVISRWGDGLPFLGDVGRDSVARMVTALRLM